ncbi:MAG: adenylate/guanylate cyclase domain-containing protein [Rhodospirillales bacterium]
MRISIRFAMAVAFGSIVVAAAAMLVLVLERGRQNTMDLVRERTELVIGQVTDRIRLHLEPIVAQAQFLSGLAEKGDLDPYAEEALIVRLSSALAATPQVAALAIIRSDYVQIRVERHEQAAVARRIDMRNVPGIEEALAAAERAERPNWSGLVWSSQLVQPLVNLRTPIRAKGRFVGEMFTTVTVTALSQVLSEWLVEGRTSAFILHGRDDVLAHPALARAQRFAKPDQPLPKANQIGDPVLAAIWDPVRDERAVAGLIGAFAGHIVNVGGTPYVFIYRQIDGYADRPWFIGRYFPLADLEEEANRLRDAAWIAFSVLLLTFAIAWSFGGAISRPVRRLARATSAIRDFALDAAKPAPRSRLSEIDEAARAYNALIAAAHWFQTYVPRRLVKRLMAQGESASALEVREVTVMFTDVVGFTRMAERMTAAETAGFLNHHFALVAECVEREEGTIDKFIGDAVMAFWGAPERQADHAIHACRAARSIAWSIAADNAMRVQNGLPPVSVRIGIHTGTVIVGNIGAPGRMNYTVVGDTVNLAQRLEALAADFLGSGNVAVLISDATASALGGAVPLDFLGAHVLRGREGPTTVYRLVEAVSQPVRSAASAPARA